MATYRQAEIAHATPESMLACAAADIEIDEDDGLAMIEVNPLHPDVTSAWDPKAIDIVNEMWTVENAADERLVEHCALMIVWSDTRQPVMVECPACDCVRPMTNFMADDAGGALADTDDPVLVCNDCL